MAKGKQKTTRRHEPSIDDFAAQDLLVHETLAEIRARLLARARRAATLEDGKSAEQDSSCRRDAWLGPWGGTKGRWHDC